ERLAQLVGEDVEQPGRLPGRALQLRTHEPQPERERDEALLRAVVEVPLEAAALCVARLDDAPPGSRELVARVRARDGEADELGECEQAMLRRERKRLVLAERDDERAPGRAGDRDRNADAAAEAERTQLAGSLAGQHV